MTSSPAASSKGHRFPAAISTHAARRYFRFPLSYRPVEEMLAARGSVVRYETIREWCGTFGPSYAAAFPRRQPHRDDKWHLDEVFLKINGKQHYLWRAVDQPGQRLDMLVTSRRAKSAAQRFFRKVLQRCRYVPWGMITDKLAREGAAKRAILPGGEHRQDKGLNHRAANSPQPTRQQERPMRRFQSPGPAQRLLSAFEPITGHFRRPRHRRAAPDYRAERRRRFQAWHVMTGAQLAA